MRNINLNSNIIYEMSLYSLFIISYLEGNGIFLFVLFITMVISMIISGFPNSYLRMGFNISSSRIAADGIFKMLQLIFLVEVAHLWGPDKFLFLFFILVLISIINLINRVAIHKQLILENISIESINQIAKTEQQLDYLVPIKKAWQLLIPFFLLGLTSTNNTINNLLLLLIILVGESVILRSLYIELIHSQTNADVKKDFRVSLIKFLVLYSFLIFVIVTNPSSNLVYLLTGLMVSVFVDLVHKICKLDANQRTRRLNI